MAYESVFESYAVSRPVEDLARAGDQGFSVLFMAGIVNPMGPTLAVLVADGPFDEDGACLPVISMSLNPFSRTYETVGQVIVGETWDPVEDVLPFLKHVRLQGCPTVLIPNIWMTPTDAVELYTRFLTRFEDGSALLEQVRRFPSNPMDRVHAQMGGLPDLLTKRKKAKARPGPRDAQRAEELARLLLEPESVRAELRALLLAWGGAIDFLHQGRTDLGAMPLPDFLRVLEMFADTCLFTGVAPGPP